jgi:hypothetical protein
MELLEDSEECLAFSNHHCIYLDVLSAYGAPELTALYCKLDDLMFQALPPTIVWRHSRTLARGDDECEFRWCRVSGGIRTDRSA